MVPAAAGLELLLLVASGSPPELPHAAVAIRAAAVAIVRVILLNFTKPLLPLVNWTGNPPYAAATKSLHQGGYLIAGWTPRSPRWSVRPARTPGQWPAR